MDKAAVDIIISGRAISSSQDLSEQVEGPSM